MAKVKAEMRRELKSPEWDKSGTRDGSGRPPLGSATARTRRPADLPLFMANARPVHWDERLFHEKHMGHTREKRELEFKGVRVRRKPPISGTDAWHAGRLYKAQRAGQAFLWSWERGLRAAFDYNVGRP